MSIKDDKDLLQETLTNLYPKWKRWLQSRHPALESIHSELLQDAAADLIDYVLVKRENQLSNSEIQKLGFTILKRRVADVFRAKTIDWVEHLPLDLLPSSDSESDPELSTRYRKLLRLIVGVVAKLDRHDRELLLRSSDAGKDKFIVMTAAERQQLHRLREQLRAELRERYAIDVDEYLKE